MCLRVPRLCLDFIPVGDKTQLWRRIVRAHCINGSATTLSLAAGPHLQDYFVIFLLLIEKNLNMSFKKREKRKRCLCPCCLALPKGLLPSVVRRNCTIAYTLTNNGTSITLLHSDILKTLKHTQTHTHARARETETLICTHPSPTPHPSPPLPSLKTLPIFTRL